MTYSGADGRSIHLQPSKSCQPWPSPARDRTIPFAAASVEATAPRPTVPQIRTVLSSLTEAKTSGLRGCQST